MQLADIDRYQTAVELIHRQLRLSVVHQITGIQPKVLRSLYREMHGKGPPAGQLPSSEGILSNRLAQAAASLFAMLYWSRVKSGNGRTIDMRALLAAHANYLEFLETSLAEVPIERLDITQAWVLARDMRTGLVEIRSCDQCQVRFLYTPYGRLSSRCPICTLKQREANESDVDREP
ncbi:MAG: flagellar transcriptional regulator FlhC [Gammaproteobacteria bacterium]|nr:flagellar transcriptional regulator FlhC [Gammaproteobacteria bacterium]